MAAFNHIAPPMDSSLEGAPDSKYSNYDVAGMESLSAEQDSPSPQGAASQGALGNPASAGETPPAFGDEGKGEGEARKPVSDFHKMFQGSSDEEKDAIADKMEQQFGDQGLSLQGAVSKVSEQGGETAMQLADAFGYIPTEKQASSGEAFKTREEALSDYGVKMDGAKEEKIVAKKRADQRRAMGGFLMDVGIRIMASNRGDGAGAIGEGLGGARDARKQDKRQSDKDSIAAADRKRRIAREDSTDEASKVRAARDAEKDAYEKTQRPAEEAKTRRAGMQQITNDDGEVYYFDPDKPSKGKYVVDEEGNRVLSKDAGLSAAQVATNERAYKAARGKARTAIEKDLTEYDTQYPAIAAETDSTKKKALIDAAVDEVLARDGYDDSGNPQETNYLDW